MIDKKEIEAVSEVLRSQILSGYRANKEHELGGKKVQELESLFCEYFGVQYAIAVNSATSGLFLSCKALGLQQEDAVMTTPYTFSATATSILMAGLDVQFADIDENTFNFDVWEAETTPATRAMIPVHLMGNPCNMHDIMWEADALELKVIEDCAQAIGAKYHGKYVGTFGDCGVFSFQQSKPINAGEGGMVITNNDLIAESIRLMRNHGEVYSGKPILGYNMRMSEVTAAIAIEQFKKIDMMNALTIERAEELSRKLEQIDGLTTPVKEDDCVHVYYTYGVRFDKEKLGMHRDEFQDRMIENGLYFGKGYVKPLHLLPLFGGHEGDYPVAERMWKEELAVTNILSVEVDIDNIMKIMRHILGK